MISLVSACTALVASIVAPFVTLAVAKRQFNATVLSANRQKWIEEVRDALAELIALLVAAVVVRSEWKEKWNKGRGPLTADTAMLEKMQRLVFVQCKIRLLLNPIEEDHQRLYRAIETALKHLQLQDTPDSDTEAEVENITRLAQTILKREWQRVKRGT